MERKCLADVKDWDVVVRWYWRYPIRYPM